MPKKINKVQFSHLQTESHRELQAFTTAIRRVIKSGWYILGREVQEFENQFSSYLRVKHCIGVANGLEALQISLMALGIGKDDEVITTPLSAAATTLAILAVGAKPVFIDVAFDANIDTSQVEKKISRRTKAILPVHLYGQPANLTKFKAICAKHKLYLIEDACQAHGSTYKKAKLGTIGDLGCFSFYPTKNLGALGDGGAIVTNKDNLAEACRQIRDYGQSAKYIHTTYGLNSRLDELQAAILKIKLKDLDKYNLKRKKIAARYIHKLKNTRELNIITQDLSNSNFHLFVISTKHRNDLQEYLSQKSIQTLIHYPLPIPDQKFIKSQVTAPHFPIAGKLSKQILSLPCHPFISLKEVDYICEQIEAFFGKTL